MESTESEQIKKPKKRRKKSGVKVSPIIVAYDLSKNSNLKHPPLVISDDAELLESSSSEDTSTEESGDEVRNKQVSSKQRGLNYNKQVCAGTSPYFRDSASESIYNDLKKEVFPNLDAFYQRVVLPMNDVYEGCKEEKLKAA
jgi:hypothetical protein